MSTLKRASITGLSIILLLMSAKSIYAQNEDAFVREAIVSKKDAIILSAIFPGLGQMTQGQKIKGLSYFMAEAASMIIFINCHENFNTKEKTYNNDLKTFNNSAVKAGQSYGRYSYASELYSDLKSRKDDLDNLNTIRNTALVVAVSVYALNIVDAILFLKSPTESQKTDRGERVIISSSMIDNTPGITLTKRF